MAEGNPKWFDKTEVGTGHTCTFITLMPGRDTVVEQRPKPAISLIVARRGTKSPPFCAFLSKVSKLDVME
ncbi:MAG: hypothetical protein ACLR6I_07370 [Waltera sp.]